MVSENEHNISYLVFCITLGKSPNVKNPYFFAGRSTECDSCQYLFNTAKLLLYLQNILFSDMHILRHSPASCDA